MTDRIHLSNFSGYPKFEDSKNGCGKDGDVKAKSFFGNSISINGLRNGTKCTREVNTGSLIDYLNTQLKEEDQIEKGSWFFAIGRDDDGKVLAAYNKVFPSNSNPPTQNDHPADSLTEKVDSDNDINFKARAFIRDNKLDEAIKLIPEADNKTEIVTQLSLVFFDHNQPEKAFELINQYCNHKTKKDVVISIMDDNIIRLNGIDDVIKATEIIDVYTKDTLLSDYAKSKYITLDESLKMMNHVVAKDKKIEYFTSIATKLYESNDRDRAFELIKDYVDDLKPNDALMKNLAKSFFDKKDFDQAMKVALKLSDPSLILYDIADVYLKEGKLDKINRIIDSMNDMESRDAIIVKAAKAHCDHEDPEAAIEMCKKLFDDEMEPEILKYVAQYYFNKGMDKEGNEILSKIQS
jgi:thioredoxin-like negative regulator of GroEL